MRTFQRPSGRIRRPIRAKAVEIPSRPLLAPLNAQLSGFRTVCKSFARRFAVNGINGLGGGENQVQKYHATRRHYPNPKCPLD